MAETANVTPEPTEDSLMGSAVAKKFPGFGKELWDGEIIDGPDPKGRWCVYWARDDSTTWHSRSMLEKILTRRGPAADDDAPAAAEPAAAAAAATTEMPPLPETPREAMPPLPPPTPTEAASLQQPPKKKAPQVHEVPVPPGVLVSSARRRGHGGARRSRGVASNGRRWPRCDAVDARRAEAERACHAIADAERGDRATRNAGQAKKSDCVCPKKAAPRGKKKSKLPETDEPLEAIESRFLGEDEDERELEDCRERKGALDEEAARLKAGARGDACGAGAGTPSSTRKEEAQEATPKKAFEVGSIVDADCKAFGPQYVEAARNGGPKKFSGVIVRDAAQ